MKLMLVSLTLINTKEIWVEFRLVLFYPLIKGSRAYSEQAPITLP